MVFRAFARAFVPIILTVGVALVAPGQAAALPPASCPVAAGNPAVFASPTNSGCESVFMVPTGVTSIHVVAIGGTGGEGISLVGGAGGAGALVTADLPVFPGETLYVLVGGNGGPDGGGGGFNGGAPGGSPADRGGGGGGGASDVRTASDPQSRLVVAAGGGGGGSFGGAGGAAGADGAGGVSPDEGAGGAAGSLSTGGAGGAPPSGCGCGAGLSGTLAVGGAGGNLGPLAFGGGGGGGGGGLYGGGGGASDGGESSMAPHRAGGGGGGSSYVIPQAAGVITTQAGTTPSVTLSWNVPAAIAGPGSLSFAGQAQGTTSAPQTVTVTNSGLAPLTVYGESFTGADADDFFVGADTCGGQVAPGAGCRLAIRFAPQGPGARSATLSIAGDAPSSPLTVSLSGTGGALPGGAPGQRGAPGPRGAPGKVRLVSCRTVTKTIRRHGKKRKAHRKKCTTKLINGTATFTTVAHATLMRGGRVYASGAARGHELVLHARRPIPAGRYSLVVRYRLDGHRKVNRRSIRVS